MKRVYFIKPIGMDGPIKIGCSQSPTTRRDVLAAWSPFALEIIAELEGGFDLEKRIHKALWHLHERREWFRADPIIDAIVKAANEGNFMMGMLPDNPPPDGKWRAKKPMPAWVPKQTALSGKVWRAECDSGYRCPIDYHNIWKHGREAELPVIEQFLADPHTNGVPCKYPYGEVRRAKYHEHRARIEQRAA